MKVLLATLGCKLNQAETEALTRHLADSGHQIVSSVGEAEVYVLNTCTVTQTADAKSRHLLRLALRRNPAIQLVITGCYAQRAREELSRLEGVRMVVSNEEKSSLPNILDQLARTDGICSIPDLERPNPPATRTRAFVKIQDGCSKYCTYCIVPFVRGVEKSLPADSIIHETKMREAEGFKEIVLTGTEVGAYDDNGNSLKTLLERILIETDIERIRLSSLQPQEITSELIGVWNNPRLCPHFHLSLQSGSDNVLLRMRRHYSTVVFRQAVTLVRSMVPDVAITTDVITGFPGETDTEFEESYNFCKEIGFARIHVFPYSPRQGTKAAEMKPQVRESIKRERNRRLLAFAEASEMAFKRKFSSRKMPVLWEGEKGGVWSGHTANYITVYTHSNLDLKNKLIEVRLGKFWGDGMWGDCAEPVC